MWDGLPRGSRTSHSTSLPGLECRLLCTISSCAVRASPNKALPVTWRSLSRRSVASARLYAQIKNQRHRLCSEAVNESKYWMHYAACSGQYAFAADEARLALSNSGCSQSSTAIHFGWSFQRKIVSQRKLEKESVTSINKYYFRSKTFLVYGSYALALMVQL